MDFFVGDNFKYLGAGAIIAAIIISIFNVALQAMKNRAERLLAERRFKFEENLAERKFEYEKIMAERKFELDNKRSVREKRQQLAEEVLAMAYDVKVAIDYMRNPWNREEAKSRIRDTNESEYETLIKDGFYVLIQRFEEESECINNFVNRRFRMRAWFGEEADKPFKIFNTRIQTMVNGAQLILKQPDYKNHLAPILKVHGTEDLIEKEIDDAIQLLENLCRPILSEQPDG